MKRFGTLFASYLALFFVLSYPSSASLFSTFLGDEGDGMQNLWNVWWVKYSLFHLHTNPLVTKFIFFPEGASLLGHTISLTNTIPAAILSYVFGLATAYNIWLILGFVLGGVFTAYLFLEFGSGLLGAFVAGFLYTFSEYHFAHSVGHFQLIAVEWLPLFLWSWLRLIDRPSAIRAAIASCAFLLVFFTDYYYVLYAAIAGAIALAFRLGANRAQLRDKKLWISLTLFTAIVMCAAGPIVAVTLPFLHTQLTGSHSAFEFGSDLLAPFVPGKYWRFANLTQTLWSLFKSPAIEGCTYLGWSALILAGIGLFTRRKCLAWKDWFLLTTAVFFLALSFGPIPHIGGYTIRGIWGAYHHFETLLPILKDGGVPDRMIVMTILAVALLAGKGVECLRMQANNTALAIILLVGFVELMPSGLPNTPTPHPHFFAQMQSLPGGYGVFDSGASRPQGAWLRYFQTQHELATASGLSSRLPVSLIATQQSIEQSARRGEWPHLCQDLGFRYVLLATTDPVPEALQKKKPILEEDGLRLFDLGEALPGKTGPCLLRH
jgi:hypothetical protein